MTIQEILTQGQGLILGPVEVQQNYGKKKAGQADKLGLLISDASGKTIVNLWGTSASADIPPGSLITIKASGEKSGIAVNEWQGKQSLNANGCNVVFEGTSSAQPASSYQAPSSHSGGECLSNIEMAEKIVLNAQIVYQMAHEANLPEEVAISLASNCNQHMAMWFFGEKFPGKNAK